jgi:hypothetical protein
MQINVQQVLDNLHAKVGNILQSSMAP